MVFLNNLFVKLKNNDADASTLAVSAPPASTQTIAEPVVKKLRKPRVKKIVNPETKSETTPQVKVLKFDFDPENPQIGSMELDWNAEFIEMLRVNGYRGVNPEALVDAWLNDVARNILASTPSNVQPIETASRYVNRRDIGDGRSEIS